MSHQLNQIIENQILDGWIKRFSRHPDQINIPHETDAELLSIPGCEDLIAFTTDTISEEITLGFYNDHYTIGWMGATVTLSDLAAVGAKPTGLLVSITIPENTPASEQQEIAKGLEDACREAGTYILGGDTNTGPQLSITTSGIGQVDRQYLLKRTGCNAGDLLFATGRLGSGGPVAAKALFNVTGQESSDPFRPVARVKESEIIRQFASACMDSSDGLIATLDQLSRLNSVGFELVAPADQFMDQGALSVCKSLGADPLLMLAQPHGEFELIFTLPENLQKPFESHAKENGFDFFFLGRAIPEPVIRLGERGQRIVDAAGLRNLIYEVDGDLERYRDELFKRTAGGS